VQNLGFFSIRRIENVFDSNVRIDEQLFYQIRFRSVKKLSHTWMFHSFVFSPCSGVGYIKRKLALSFNTTMELIRTGDNSIRVITKSAKNMDTVITVDTEVDEVDPFDNKIRVTHVQSPPYYSCFFDPPVMENGEGHNCNCWIKWLFLVGLKCIKTHALMTKLICFNCYCLGEGHLGP